MTSEIGLELPEILPIMPSHEGVVFPYTIVPRTVTSEHAIQLIDDAVNGFKMIGLCAVRPGDDHLSQPGPDSIFRIGTVTGIDRLYRFPGNIVRLHLRGLARFRIVEFIDSDRPYLLARIERLTTEFPSRGPEMDAWRNTVELQMKQVLELSPGVADDSQLLDLARDPERLGFVAAGRIDASVEDRQAILEENDIVRRLRLLSGIMAQEIKVLRLRNKIQGQVRAEIEKDQKEYILKEQMKAIQKELGGEGENPEVDELRERLEEKELPDHVRETAEEELDRLSKMHPGLPEVAVIRTYIDWILCLPWLDITTDRLDIGAARDVLEADHYDLKEVKERILEFIAVRKLNPAGKAPILCFVGPPGVGKTSMGRSIARAMGRKFVRLSLGGVHDEAEIRGHRKTYIGAMPGKIIQGLKEAGSSNPVFMLDEVDKIGNDFRGDPTSALLEVLDPEQNYSFRDNYINVPFDLSRVQFITTANRLDTIPPPLKDRMEIVRIPGYTSGEKLEIAGRYLVSRQRGNAGLTGAGIRFTRKGIEDIISSYTREAGVRELERQIGRICRKVAMRFADGDSRLVVVGRSSLHGFLGPKRYTTEKTYAEPRVGVVAGLAWTPTGGEILLIEAMVMKGKGSLVLTGQLGDVMKESATAALSWIRHHAADYGITGDFSERDIHVHVPAGATPKDGPSAGVAMLLSILSALTAKPVRHDVAVTGEISLQGRVMPVGGIKEKALGALAAGITTVIIPEENLRDLEEVPENIRGMMIFEHVRDVWTVIPRMIEGLKGVVE
jgi:ATP-dependent Lon protease